MSSLGLLALPSCKGLGDTVTTSMLEKLRSEFLQEARSAPKLFRDLAKVEHYIAESYKTRALIELIQNADDAGATIFGVHGFRSGFVVGNDGRAFTIQDVEALCRSGSSNKNRGGSTIGYRGIGFKSVVNLAKRIYVFSGEFAFYFDKNKTQETVQSNIDVPLIRVPHSVQEAYDLSLAGEIRDVKNNYRYQTVFLFEFLNERLSLEDLSGFDRSSLLFLQHLRRVHLDFQDIKRDISLEATRQDQCNIVTIAESRELDAWEILSSETNPISKVAVKKFNNAIIPASLEESVIHSFTPTLEFAGAYIKINGDFTTDPSRKNVDMDELSQKSFQEAVVVIVETIVALLSTDAVKLGFFTPFINVRPQETSRFKILLFKAIEEGLAKNRLILPGNKPVSFATLRLKPDWLNFEDYEKICRDGITAIGKGFVLAYPELFSFLEALHVKTLTLEDVLHRINSIDLTLLGSAEIFTKIAKQYRYDLDTEKLEQLKGLRIFPMGNNLVRAKDVKATEALRPEFCAHLKDHADLDDVMVILKKLGIGITDGFRATADKNSKSTQEQSLSPVPPEPSRKPFTSEPAIKKWRSAEQNAAEYFRALQGVLSAIDVSKANLGYDLEVLLSDGTKAYVEVKSVSSFAEPFKITPNEYSSAHNYGDNYYIALVINDGPFQVKLIQNPVNALRFEKKCEQWSWCCEQYGSALRDPVHLLR
jgi:hypothetical protein